MKTLSYFDDYMILIAVESLNYMENDIDVIQITQKAFSQFPTAKDGSRVNDKNFPSRIYYRVSGKKAKQIIYEQGHKKYAELIAKKYGLPGNWQENRWIVEQVRPTLY